MQPVIAYEYFKFDSNTLSDVSDLAFKYLKTINFGSGAEIRVDRKKLEAILLCSFFSSRMEKEFHVTNSYAHQLNKLRKFYGMPKPQLDSFLSANLHLSKLVYLSRRIEIIPRYICMSEISLKKN